MRHQRLDARSLEEWHQTERDDQVGDGRRQSHSQQQRDDHGARQHQKFAVRYELRQQNAKALRQVRGLERLRQRTDGDQQKRKQRDQCQPVIKGAEQLFPAGISRAADGSRTRMG